MAGQRSNSDFLNGVPELLALRLLARQPMYGYQLIESMKLASGHVFNFGEGCLYPILHRLEAQGFLSSQRELVQGRSRVVYSVTTAGLNSLNRTTAEWRQIASTIDQILSPAEQAIQLAG